MTITFHVAKWSHFHARCHANLIAPDARKLQMQLKLLGRLYCLKHAYHKYVDILGKFCPKAIFFDQKEMKEMRKENYLYVSIKRKIKFSYSHTSLLNVQLKKNSFKKFRMFIIIDLVKLYVMSFDSFVFQILIYFIV
jgi:hypothetical protein